MKVLSVDGLSKLISLMKEDFVESSSLSTVATSGSYNDLSNKPTIPEGLPSQSGNSGKFLTTNGTTASWATLNALQNTATGTNSLSILGSSSTNNSISIGYNTSAGQRSVALGTSASVTWADGIAIGQEATATANTSIAIGAYSHATALNAIQIGSGTNSTATTLQIWSHQLLDLSTGLIPNARLNTMTGADGTNGGTKGAVPAPAATDNTKFLRGDGTWATVSGGGSSLPDQTGQSGKYLTTNGTIASWGTITIPTVDQTYSSSSTSTNALSHKAIADAKFIQNTATGLNSTTIEGIATSQALSVNIGKTSIANSQGAVAIGSSASVNVLSNYGIAIGCSSITNGAYAIQLGKGTNSEANSFYVGLSDSNNYKLLGNDGKIPDDRLNTTIARTSQIPSTANMQTTTNLVTLLSSSSTDTQYPSAKCVYDLIGNLESILNNINNGNIS